MSRPITVQARENGGKASPAPNLFAAGPNGALRSQRRGRPQLEPKNSSQVGDLPTISAASTQIRTSSPQIKSPDSTAAPQAQAAAPARKSTVSGFDDDAWAPRPSSTQGIKSNTPQPLLATPTPTPPPPPPAPVAPPVMAAPQPSFIPPPRPSTAGGGGGGGSDLDIFAKIANLRPPSAPISSAAGLRPSPSPQISSPTGYHQGLGVGSSPSPMGQYITAQATGALSPPINAPRGPFAPVPSNQTLLTPLVPTNTGFGGFVPTRPSPLNSQPTGLPQNNFLQQQPTGFQPQQQQQFQPQPTGFAPSLQPQPTGFTPSFQPQPTGFTPSLQPQATGFGGPSNFGGGGFNINGPSGLSMQQSEFKDILRTKVGTEWIVYRTAGFQPQAQPQFQQGGSMFDNLARASQHQPSPPPPPHDTSPANVFANMKAGNFGRDSPGLPQDSSQSTRLFLPAMSVC